MESRQIGRAQIGGPFKLTTHYNKPFSELDLLGKWSLLYFGFTNCPDICPAELDKMSSIVDALGVPPSPFSLVTALIRYAVTEKDYGTLFQPVFISVDPARDSTSNITRYLSDFHPRFIGLTGEYASIKSICKAFRVYFSTPPNADPQGDYLVDHSIFIYLMDPNGEFVEAFGQATTVEDVVSRARKEVELGGDGTH
jgi:protein SCO1/2